MGTKKTIDDLTLLENYIVALNFPDKGIVPFRVVAREQLKFDPYVVDYTSATNVFTADVWKDASKLGHPTDTSVDNILEVDEALHLYQVFYGIRPSLIRGYMNYPSGKPRRNLDIKEVSSKAHFGYVDGSMSPYDDPQPVSEFWVPKDLDVSFAWYNPASVSNIITTKWIINLYAVRVLRDVDLVEKILKRKGEGAQCRIATLGGVESFNYSPENVWNVNPIPLTATKEEIAAALGVIG